MLKMDVMCKKLASFWSVNSQYFFVNLTPPVSDHLPYNRGGICGASYSPPVVGGVSAGRGGYTYKYTQSLLTDNYLKYFFASIYYGAG